MLKKNEMLQTNITEQTLREGRELYYRDYPHINRFISVYAKAVSLYQLNRRQGIAKTTSTTAARDSSKPPTLTEYVLGFN